jgi:myosin-5
MQAQFDIEKNQILAEIEAERSHHQRILKDYNRLQQRFENLQDEVEILQSPTVSPNKEPALGKLITIQIYLALQKSQAEMLQKINVL